MKIKPKKIKKPGATSSAAKSLTLPQKIFRYGLATTVVGGIGAAIGVPVALANAKINNHAGLDKVDYTKQAWTGGPTPQELIDKKSEIKEPADFRKKIDEVAAKFLYKKEQEASYKIQELDFYWKQFNQLKNVRSYLENTLNVHDKTVIGDSDTDEFIYGFDIKGRTGTNKQIPLADFANKKALTANYKTMFDYLISEITNEKKKLKSKDKSDAYQREIDTFTKKWNDLQKKIDDVKKGSAIDFDQDAFSSKYPLVLLPMDKIKAKQTTIFNNAHDAFISNFKQDGDGEGEWLKNELSKRYAGATNSKEAIDYLINSQIQYTAFKRFNYKLDSSYTIEKVKSLIFKDIVGAFDTQDPKSAANEKTTQNVIFSKNHIKNNDKVYFLSTSSNIINLINMNAGSQPMIDQITVSLQATNIVKLQNMVLNIKQGKTFEAPWTVDKDLIKKIFTPYGDATNTTPTLKLPIDHLADMFTATTTPDIEAERKLFGNFSSTTDGTQWKLGDLGYMTALKATTGMVPAFGTAVASVLSTQIQSSPGAGNQPITGSNDILKNIMGDDAINPTGLAKGFLDAATAKGQLGNYITSGKFTAGKKADLFNGTKNKEIQEFIDSLSKDDLNKYFGTAVQEVFQKVTETKANGKDISGIGQVYWLNTSEMDNTKKIFMVITKEFGIHVFKVNDVNGNNIEADMFKEQENQAKDPKNYKQSTNFASLFSGSYDRTDQILDLINNLTDGQAFKDELNKISNYTKVGTSIANDAENLLKDTKTNKSLELVNKANPGKLSDYITSSYDSDLLSEDLSADPAKIYDLILFLGGNK